MTYFNPALSARCLAAVTTGLEGVLGACTSGLTLPTLLCPTTAVPSLSELLLAPAYTQALGQVCEGCACQEALDDFADVVLPACGREQVVVDARTLPVFRALLVGGGEAASPLPLDAPTLHVTLSVGRAVMCAEGPIGYGRRARCMTDFYGDVYLAAYPRGAAHALEYLETLAAQSSLRCHPCFQGQVRAVLDLVPELLASGMDLRQWGLDALSTGCGGGDASTSTTVTSTGSRSTRSYGDASTTTAITTTKSTSPATLTALFGVPYAYGSPSPAPRSTSTPVQPAAGAIASGAGGTVAPALLTAFAVLLAVIVAQ